MFTFFLLSIALAACSVLGAPATTSSTSLVVPKPAGTIVSEPVTRNDSITQVHDYVATLGKRNNALTWHYLCIDAQWEACEFFQYNINTCNRLEPTWAKRVSSWQPPKGVKCYGYGGSYCKKWKPEDCHSDSCWKVGGNPVIGPVRYPGINTLEGWQHGDINWNDRMGSFICYQEH